MSADFRVFFKRKRQYFDVFLHDVHPNTFNSRGGGRWGYFEREEGGHPRKGKFGEIHLVKSRVRVDTVSHELDHLRCAWVREGNKENCFTINVWNEEWFCIFGDELTRKFWKEYERFSKSTK